MINNQDMMCFIFSKLFQQGGWVLQSIPDFLASDGSKCMRALARIKTPPPPPLRCLHSFSLGNRSNRELVERMLLAIRSGKFI